MIPRGFLRVDRCVSLKAGSPSIFDDLASEKSNEPFASERRADRVDALDISMGIVRRMINFIIIGTTGKLI